MSNRSPRSFLNTTRQEVVATFRPRPDGPDGPLPPLLLTLTVVTGLVDATSYLKLGHVFVANMTGAVFQDAGFFPVDLGGLTGGGEMQQIHHPLAGLNLIRLGAP